MFRSDALTLETAAWFGSSVNDLTFWTFSVSPSVFPVGPVVGGVGGALLLLAVFGFSIWRRNNNGEITADFTPIMNLEFMHLVVICTYMIFLVIFLVSDLIIWLC